MGKFILNKVYLILYIIKNNIDLPNCLDNILGNIYLLKKDNNNTNPRKT